MENKLKKENYLSERDLVKTFLLHLGERSALAPLDRTDKIRATFLEFDLHGKGVESSSQSSLE